MNAKLRTALGYEGQPRAASDAVASGSPTWQVLEGDALERLRTLPAESVQTCITSPPYFGLRDYGVEGQIGLEATPDEYVARLVEVFREVRRVLRDDGTLWLNLGDSYATYPGNRGYSATGMADRRGRDPILPKGAGLRGGTKPKDLLGIPWLVAFALRADSWYLRSDIIWAKPNPMPESVTDRPTKAHEYLFLLSKGPRYFYDADAVRESHAREWDATAPNGTTGRDTYSAPCILNSRNPQSGIAEMKPNPAGRNKRSVWTVSTKPYAAAHFATFPPDLIEPCILAGSGPDATVLDPFAGAGTTGLVALRHDRSFIGIELSPTYCELARNRIRDDGPLFNVASEVAA